MRRQRTYVVFTDPLVVRILAAALQRCAFGNMSKDLSSLASLGLNFISYLWPISLD